MPRVPTHLIPTSTRVTRSAVAPPAPAPPPPPPSNNNRARRRRVQSPPRPQSPAAPPPADNDEDDPPSSDEDEEPPSDPEDLDDGDTFEPGQAAQAAQEAEDNDDDEDGDGDGVEGEDEIDELDIEDARDALQQEEDDEAALGPDNIADMMIDLGESVPDPDEELTPEEEEAEEAKNRLRREIKAGLEGGQLDCDTYSFFTTIQNYAHHTNAINGFQTISLVSHVPPRHKPKCERDEFMADWMLLADCGHEI